MIIVNPGVSAVTGSVPPPGNGAVSETGHVEHATRRSGGINAPYDRTSSCPPCDRDLGSGSQSDLRVANNPGRPARATSSLHQNTCSPVPVGRVCMAWHAAFGNFPTRAHRRFEMGRATLATVSGDRGRRVDRIPRSWSWFIKDVSSESRGTPWPTGNAPAVAR